MLELLLLLMGASTANATDPSANGRRSGFEFMSTAIQAMQTDDAQNPGMLWVKDGETLWNQKTGRSDKSCASCHGDAGVSMRGVAARYPALDERTGRPINLSQRINLCRMAHQQVSPLPGESQEILSLESYVAHQSRGLPVAPSGDPGWRPLCAVDSRSSPSAWGRSTFPAPSATTSWPASAWAAASSHRRMPRATPCTALSGKAWAHCSGACAIA